MTKSEFIEQTLPFVSKASRYLGNEVNAVRKDLSSVSLTFALAFPDAYEIGMSHLGLHILYHVLNSRDDIACERVFAPWPDMETVMRRRGIALATLESHRPLGECDIIGFSLEYELSYATVLRMLDLAGIPLHARSRDETMPLLIAGGPSTYNPEPVADFFDAFVIGDGEEVILEVCEACMRWKKRRAPKQELLRALSEIPGVYVPSFFAIGYGSDGAISEIIPLVKGYTGITKRTISQFSDAPYCTAPVVPYMQIVHDRAAVEIARGCSRGCRFCMAGMIYRPVREKTVSAIRQLARETLENTGYDELALASLSTGDYSAVQELTELLMKDLCRSHIAVSLPSLRVETLSRNLMEEIKRVRKTGFTIAPEAGTQRLRNVINKGFTEEEILTTASHIFAAGWNLIKLYFMIGLPTETGDDLEAVRALSRKIAAIDRKKQLNVSVSTFVPKPHTPFQWESQDPPETTRDKQAFLRKTLRGGNIRFKWHDYRLSALEGVFSRGDRRLSSVLVCAHELGAGFESWSDHFNPDIWEAAFARCGIDDRFYLRQLSPECLLPWSHISCGIDTGFLKKEREKAFREETTPDCRSGNCTECGVCTGKSRKIECAGPVDVPAESRPETAQDTQNAAVYSYRFWYSKTGPARFLSHLELSGTVTRAMRRARLPLRYSQGFHPLPRIVFSDALPVGMESVHEYCTVELTRRYSAQELAAVVNPHLPEGLTVFKVEENTLKNKALADRITKYILLLPEHAMPGFPCRSTMEQCIAEFSRKDECPVQTLKKGEAVTVDVKPLIEKIALSSKNAVELQLHSSRKKTPKVMEILAEIFHIGEEEKQALRICKVS